MADEVDVANEQADAYLAARVADARKGPKTVATGRCLNCDSLLPPGLLYCDSACKQDAEHRDMMTRRAGAKRQ